MDESDRVQEQLQDGARTAGPEGGRTRRRYGVKRSVEGKIVDSRSAVATRLSESCLPRSQWWHCQLSRCDEWQASLSRQARSARTVLLLPDRSGQPIDCRVR